MPQYCAVPFCKNRKGGHLFPNNPSLRRDWVIKIKRAQTPTGKLWIPGEHDVVCSDHFKASDYIYSGKDQTKKRLKKTAIPSIFIADTEINEREQRAVKRRSNCLSKNSNDIVPTVSNEVVVEADNLNSEVGTNKRLKVDCSSQCTLVSGDLLLNINKIKDDKRALQYYTGFDDYNHFILFFRCLGPAAYHLNYQCEILTVENQLFLTLVKIRQAKENRELSILFKVSESTVSRIFNVWVNFMYFQLKELDIWPSQKIIKQHMPESFSNSFPTTRVILDATEIPIDKPSHVLAQRATFSSYKNKNTLKTMIGISPNGLVSYVSPSFGGSASDRQIIEDSSLYKEAYQYFNTKDSIMADRGILVQDLFATFNVLVNTPTLLKGKHQLDAKDVVKDRRVASHRIHVERVIGLSKTYKILNCTLSHQLVPLGSRIIFLCFMLANFRTSIVT